jgi:uncharacterized ferritin-like protein (DUF455 family)
VPRRRPGTLAGRIALLHAVAHIELNAVDLHWDIIARFSHVPMPPGFYDDWVKAADEESKHFNLMCDCLEALGSHYGALPAHAGMWRAAEDTADDLLGRLAVVPMVLEARGLDVTPGMIDIFRKSGDAGAIVALETIYSEEVGHVAYGSKWFNFLCGRDNIDPKDAFHALVRRYFHGALKPPFNEEKRAEAGPTAGFLLAAGRGKRPLALTAWLYSFRKFGEILPIGPPSRRAMPDILQNELPRRDVVANAMQSARWGMGRCLSDSCQERGQSA